MRRLNGESSGCKKSAGAGVLLGNLATLRLICIIRLPEDAYLTAPLLCLCDSNLIVCHGAWRTCGRQSRAKCDGVNSHEAVDSIDFLTLHRAATFNSLDDIDSGCRADVERHFNLKLVPRYRLCQEMCRKTLEVYGPCTIHV